MTRSRFLALAIAGVGLSACHKKSRVAQGPAVPHPGPATQSGGAPAQPRGSAGSPARRPARALTPSEYEPENGVASWYGHPYHGRPSASGEIYDMEQMTAAHRTLPFGTRVHVEDLDNGKSVEVRINDRGPFVDNRIIDLSHAAAVEMGMIGPGVARVRLTIVGAPALPEPAVFAIQVAAFADRENAARMQARMTAQYGAAALRLRAGNPPLWRVLVGHVSDTDEAETLAKQIRTAERVPEAFIMRLDPGPGPSANSTTIR